MTKELSESKLESYFCEKVKALGGYAWKFTSPSNSGVPDRLITWPNNVVHFVELKTDSGRLSEIQMHQQERLERYHCVVYTAYGKEGIDTYFEDIAP